MTWTNYKGVLVLTGLLAAGGGGVLWWQSPARAPFVHAVDHAEIAAAGIACRSEQLGFTVTNWTYGMYVTQTNVAGASTNVSLVWTNVPNAIGLFPSSAMRDSGIIGAFEACASELYGCPSVAVEPPFIDPVPADDSYDGVQSFSPILRVLTHQRVTPLRWPVATWPSNVCAHIGSRFTTTNSAGSGVTLNFTRTNLFLSTNLLSWTYGAFHRMRDTCPVAYQSMPTFDVWFGAGEDSWWTEQDYTPPYHWHINYSKSRVARDELANQWATGTNYSGHVVVQTVTNGTPYWWNSLFGSWGLAAPGGYVARRITREAYSLTNGDGFILNVPASEMIYVYMCRVRYQVANLWTNQQKRVEWYLYPGASGSLSNYWPMTFACFSNAVFDAMGYASAEPYGTGAWKRVESTSLNNDTNAVSGYVGSWIIPSFDIGNGTIRGWMPQPGMWYQAEAFGPSSYVIPIVRWKQIDCTNDVFDSLIGQ